MRKSTLKSMLPFIVVCFALLRVASSEQYCTAANNETPSMLMCQDGSMQGAEGETLYLDSLGAPKHQSVECDCALTFNFTATITVTYRSPGFSDNCGIQFDVSGFTWSCEQSVTTQFVSGQENNITFIKTRDDIGDIHGCIGLAPAAGSSLHIHCYPSREYMPTVATTSTATSTETTSSTTGSSTPSTSSTAGQTTTAVAQSTSQPLATTQPSTSTPLTTQPSTTTTEPNIGASGDDGDSNTGAIVGGVVGGISGLVVIIVVIVCIVCLARRRTRGEKTDSVVHGPRSVRYTSTGDDVTVTENRLYEGDQEAPSTAVNALFVGGIPLTNDESMTGLPYIPSTNADGRYVNLPGAAKENGSAVNRDTDMMVADITLEDEYSEINTGNDNPAFQDSDHKSPMYRAPYDEITHSEDVKDTDGQQRSPAPNGGRHPSDSSSSSASPYDYIEHGNIEQGKIC